MVNLLDFFKNNIIQHQLISPGDRGLIAFSGGPDSLCLLHLLVQLRSSWNLTLEALHVDHGLRPESADEARQACALAHDLAVECRIIRLDLSNHSVRNKQERARQARLKLLRDHAHEGGFQWIALAHTATDQAETVLMRATRGAGPKGLAGMAFKSGLFIRPLLATTREEIVTYLNQYQMEPVQDPTNNTDQYFRNRVRRHVIPLLAQENPGVVQALCRLATTCREDDEALTQIAMEIIERAGRPDGYDIGLLQPLAPALLHRTLQLAFQKASGDLRHLERQHIEQLAEQIKQATAGTHLLDIPGFRVERSYNRLRFHLRTNPLDELEEQKIFGLGNSQLSDGRILYINRALPENGMAQIKRLALDAEKVQFPLVVRAPQYGDQIAIGPGCAKKVMRVLLDAKIPRLERSHIPVLLSNDQIVLIVGLRRAYGYGAREGQPSLFVYLSEP